MTGHMDAPVTPDVTGAKPDWHPPKLIELGDAATLTEAQALASNDGGGGSS